MYMILTSLSYLFALCGKRQSPAKGKPSKRNRSKSIHTSVPTALESDEKPKASSDDELEVPQLDQTNGSDAEDSETDGMKR